MTSSRLTTRVTRLATNQVIPPAKLNQPATFTLVSEAATIEGYTVAETDLSITKLDGSQVHVTAFEDCQVCPDYRATLSFGEEQAPSELRENTDGDGPVDRTTEPTSTETVALSAGVEEPGLVDAALILQALAVPLVVAGGAGLAWWSLRRGA